MSICFENYKKLVIKCMIVFQVLNFDPVKKILTIQCHIYILIKIVIILKKIRVKSLLLLHRKKLNIFMPHLPIYYIQYYNRKSRLVQLLETATVGVLRKKVFLQISQNSEETPVPEETLVNFAKFLRKPFLQNDSGLLLLKCRHCNNEARDIDCICCRELDAMLIASAKIPEREG